MSEFLTADRLTAAIAGMSAEAVPETNGHATEGNLNGHHADASQSASDFPPGDDRETVRTALQVIDPDLPYQEWLSVLMAAHSVDASGSMLAMVDDWSRRGSKYKDGEVEAKWGSFEPNGGTTVATIAHLADQTGQIWRTSRPKPQTNGSRPISSSPTDPPKPRFSLGFIDSAKFAATDYRAKFWIKRILVAGQTTVLGGAQKVLKTSTMLDAAISLGTGTRFLGTFDVPEAVPVGVVSSESGGFVLKETATRIAHARGWGLPYCNVHWSFRTPQLGLSDHMASVAEDVKRLGLRVLFIDPLYLSMLVLDSGEAINFANLFSVGSVLRGAIEPILAADCTPVIAHHESKGAASFRRRGDNGPPELSDLAMAGFAEFFRAWILLGRREPYEHGTGLHSLWMNVGGSMGHGGLWALDIDEGQLQDDFTGRKWDVTVNTAHEARKETNDDKESFKTQRAREKADKLAANDRERVQSVLAAVPDGATFTTIRNRSGVADSRLHPLLESWLKNGSLEKCTVVGANKIPNNGYRLPKSSVEPVEPAKTPISLVPPLQALAPAVE